MRLASTLTLLVLIASFPACREGPVGPEGAARAQGSAGRAGGGVEVRTASTEFSMTLAPDARGVESLSTSAVTASALESGAVFAYVRLAGESYWWAVPCNALSDGAFFHRVVLEPGTAQLDIRRSGGDRNATLAGTFRVVVVEGAEPSRPLPAAPYEELAARYDLPLH